MSFKIYDETNAPDGSIDLLKNAKSKYGFVPNLLATMAEAPALTKAYMTLSGIFEETSFDETERQIVLLATSFANSCHYCMAAHTVIAGMQNVPQDVIKALRENTPIADPKHEALRRFVYEVAESKGNPLQGSLETFLTAGYGNQQVLEVILGVGFKTLSNYTNHIADTQLDEAFQPVAWDESETDAA